MTIALLGDIHGEVEILRRAYDKLAPLQIAALIQVGDLGYYDGPAIRLANMQFPIPTYFIPGNHEKFDLLPMNATEPVELFANFFFIPNGTVLTIDNRKIAFMGGASSVDKMFRLRQGMDWSEQELITSAQMARLDTVDKVDMLITHCPPQSVIEAHFNRQDLRYFDLDPSWTDPCAVQIEQLWQRLGHPPLYCGHMHRKVQDRTCRILDINELMIV